MKTNKNLILATILTICGGVSMQAQTVRGTVTKHHTWAMNQT